MKPQLKINSRKGFTLIEVSLSMVILTVIMLVAVQVLDQTQRTWKRGVGNIEQFREARMAFNSITQNLREALLNTYLAYQYNESDTPTVPASKSQAPARYIRQSELQFVTGQARELLPSGQAGALSGHSVFFQARLGISDRDGYENLRRLLCGRGYFLLHSNDDAFRPAHVTAARPRFRLWEYRPTAESNSIYTQQEGARWFDDALTGVVNGSDSMERPSFTRPIAENIIALVISPQVTSEDAEADDRAPWWIAPEYAYDSAIAANTGLNSPQGTQHMLPPRVVVTLVAIDEASAARLAQKYPDSIPQLIPDGAFSRCSEMRADLRALEQALVAEQLNYRVFSAAINMRNSKWGLLR